MALPKAFTSRVLPTAYCIGTVSEISEPTFKPTSGYTTVKFKINPAGSGKKCMSFMTFYPNALNGEREGKNQQRQYGQNVARILDKKYYQGFDPRLNDFDQYTGLGKFEGLCGSPEKFDEISSAVQAAYVSAASMEDFLPQLHELLEPLVGTKVGYIMKQQFVATEEVNEKGYAIKVPGQYLELAGFFYPDAKTFEVIDSVVDDYNNRPPNSKESYPEHRAVKYYTNEIPFDTYAAGEN